MLGYEQTVAVTLPQTLPQPHIERQATGSDGTC